MTHVFQDNTCQDLVQVLQSVPQMDFLAAGICHTGFVAEVADVFILDIYSSSPNLPF